MNYTQIYNDLIYKRTVLQPLFKKACAKGEVESHHIIMRSMGGTNDQSNLVNLTLREHYFAHELMVKMYKGTEFEVTAIRAWNGMSRKMGNRTKTSRLYQILRGQYNKRAGDASRGKICINNGVRNAYINPNDPLPEGYMYGQKPCSEQGRLSHLKACQKLVGSTRATDGVIEIVVGPNEKIPAGFVKGKKPTSKTSAGKIFVTDGCQNKLVEKDQIPIGFHKGMHTDVDRHEMSRQMHANMSAKTKVERNRKISEAHKGKPTWAKGKHFSEEHKEHLRQSNLGVKRDPKVGRATSLRQKGKIKVNDGVHTIYADPNNIPPGFVKGQLHKNSVKKSS